MNPTSKAEWTVMFYMDAKPPGFDKSLKVSLDEMAVTGSTNKVNIMVLLGRNKPKKMTLSGKVYDKPSVYRVLKGQEITITSPPLHVIKNNTLGDPAVLVEFLSYCTANYPANRYMLTFWDHGTGSGVEAGTEEVSEAITKILGFMGPVDGPNKNIPVDLRNKLLFRNVQKRVVSNLFRLRPSKQKVVRLTEKTKAEDYLYVTEINEAIQKVFKGQQFMDLVAFDACWLQMFENGYSLKDSCRYIVASENLISADGLGYKDFFIQLTARPLASTETVAAMLINASYIKISEDEKYTMSCLDLSKAGIIAELIDELAELLMPMLDDEDFFSIVHCARFLCLSYFDDEDPADYDLQVVDLVYFTRQLVAGINYSTNGEEVKPSFKRFYNKVIKACNKLATACAMEYTVCKQIGSAMAEQKDSDKRWGAHGFSILFPEDQYKYKDYDEGFYKKSGKIPAMPFAVEHKWKAFLETYYAQL